ncbi:phosphoribosyl-ATP pyrophosphohydrolase [Paenibacillus sp. GCM10023248]|uniref:nucleoside triphosphate pyrophosphohydrolase n=1 Tax=unclassified Paenibacillus TaxID=185978 RepID=UPI002378C926|nr:nucleoside triphosphate pyrophosphohydrolase [Paenibacillus sp. MAHUQ-63]MDD9271497.1 nucleoside triphosphate pyrophosphohydrolase [Paenibacillus sp. MAHUQ-63]
MPIYNKLVRDRIPEIISRNGSVSNTRILDEAEYKTELRTKLAEEMNEYLEATDDKNAMEELADILELLHALTSIHGSTVEQLESIRANKAEKRGGFKEKIFLIDVQDA